MWSRLKHGCQEPENEVNGLMRSPFSSEVLTAPDYELRGEFHRPEIPFTRHKRLVPSSVDKFKGRKKE